MNTQQRVEKVYNFLVDQTEDEETIYNKTRSNLLSELLPIFEYLLGMEEENPIEKAFSSNEDPVLDHDRYVKKLIGQARGA